MCHAINEGRARDAMFEAMKALNEGDVEKAKIFLKIGIFGGRVSNPLDKKEAIEQWDIYTGRSLEKKASNGG